MAKRAPKYKAKTVEHIRITVLFTEEELSRIDGWGGPAGLPNRSEAIRTLIEKGLEAQND